MADIRKVLENFLKKEQGGRRFKSEITIEGIYPNYPEEEIFAVFDGNFWYIYYNQNKWKNDTINKRIIDSLTDLARIELPFERRKELAEYVELAFKKID